MNEERVLDVASAGVVVATMVGYLPTIAAALSVVWALIRIAETETFQMLLFRLTGWSWITPRNIKDALTHKPKMEIKNAKNEDQP